MVKNTHTLLKRGGIIVEICGLFYQKIIKKGIMNMLKTKQLKRIIALAISLALLLTSLICVNAESTPTFMEWQEKTVTPGSDISQHETTFLYAFKSEKNLNGNKVTSSFNANGDSAYLTLTLTESYASALTAITKINGVDLTKSDIKVKEWSYTMTASNHIGFLYDWKQIGATIDSEGTVTHKASDYIKAWCTGVLEAGDGYYGTASGSSIDGDARENQFSYDGSKYTVGIDNWKPIGRSADKTIYYWKGAPSYKVSYTYDEELSNYQYTVTAKDVYKKVTNADSTVSYELLGDAVIASKSIDEGTAMELKYPIISAGCLNGKADITYSDISITYEEEVDFTEKCEAFGEKYKDIISGDSEDFTLAQMEEFFAKYDLMPESYKEYLSEKKGFNGTALRTAMLNLKKAAEFIVSYGEYMKENLEITDENVDAVKAAYPAWQALDSAVQGAVEATDGYENAGLNLEANYQAAYEFAPTFMGWQEKTVTPGSDISQHETTFLYAFKSEKNLNGNKVTSSFNANGDSAYLTLTLTESYASALTAITKINGVDLTKSDIKVKEWSYTMTASNHIGFLYDWKQIGATIDSEGTVTHKASDYIKAWCTGVLEAGDGYYGTASGSSIDGDARENQFSYDGSKYTVGIDNWKPIGRSADKTIYYWKGAPSYKVSYTYDEELSNYQYTVTAKDVYKKVTNADSTVSYELLGDAVIASKSIDEGTAMELKYPIISAGCLNGKADITYSDISITYEEEVDFTEKCEAFGEKYKDIISGDSEDFTLAQMEEFFAKYDLMPESYKEYLSEKKGFNGTALRIAALKNDAYIYEDFDNEDVNGASSGIKYVEGYNGGKAVYFGNSANETANDYIDFGDINLGENSFAVSYWYKHYPNYVSEAQTGTIFANKSVSGTESGLAVTDKNFTDGNASRTTVNATIGENEAVTLENIQTAGDTRWHHMVISVNRNGSLVVYIDGKISFDVSGSGNYATDIHSLVGSMGTGNLVLGADSNHENGITDAAVDEFTIYSDYLTVEEVLAMYNSDKLGAKICEIENKMENYKAGSRFTQEAIDAMNEALSTAKAIVRKKDCSNASERSSAYDTLKSQFESFLVGKTPNKVVQIASDTHIYNSSDFVYNGSSTTEEDRFKNLLTETANGELGFTVDTYLNAGDLSETSTEVGQKYAFSFYDDYLTKDKLIVQAMGNHDMNYGANNQSIIGVYFVENVKNYVDASLEYNKSLCGDDGKISTPYYYATDGDIHYVVLSTAFSGMSDEELAWLREVMPQIAEDGKPIFVVDHYTPTQNSHTNQLLSRAKEVIAAIDYEQVYYFYGHNHFGLGNVPPYTPEYAKNMTAFNLPTSGKGDSSFGYENSSYYYLFYYDDCMVLRARDSMTNEWVTEYDIELYINNRYAPIVEGASIKKNNKEGQDIRFAVTFGNVREDKEILEYGAILTLKGYNVPIEDMVYNSSNEQVKTVSSSNIAGVKTGEGFYVNVGYIPEEFYGYRYVIRAYVLYSDGTVDYSNMLDRSVIGVAKSIVSWVYNQSSETLEKYGIASTDSIITEILADGTIKWAEGAVADNGKKVFEYLYENNNAITNALENNRG